MPETKGVPLGRAMDDLFSQPGKGPQMECIEEVDETTALLRRRQRSVGRRDSIGFPARRGGEEFGLDLESRRRKSP